MSELGSERMNARNEWVSELGSELERELGSERMNAWNEWVSEWVSELGSQWVSERTSKLKNSFGMDYAKP